MKMVIAGRGWLAVRGARLFAMLAHLQPGGARLVCVPTASDGVEPTWRPSLREEARANGWPCVDRIAEAGLGPSDLLLSLQFDRIVHDAELGGARALNLHFSLLPRHRGSLSCFWPIAARDEVAGVTLHELTAEVDAGPIIAARSFPLPTFVTAGQLYRLFHSHGFELLAEQAEAVLTGTYPTRRQPAGGPPAHRRRDVEFTSLEITDFDRPAAAVRDSCLALVFPEFQVPTFRGRPVEQAYALPSGRTGHAVGDVVAQTERSALVRCADALVCFEFSG
jgi:methionyl-tRNA formyltransferase